MKSNEPAAARIIGTLRSADGKGVVRMEDRFDTTIDDLWSALTDPDRLARWLGEIDGDLRLGGTFRARFFSSGWEGTGHVETCDPPQRLTVTTTGTDATDSANIEATLTADGDQTVLVLEERGMPLDLIAGYGAGIQTHIEHLAAHISGQPLRDADTLWQDLFPAYEVLAAQVREQPPTP